jgi:legumain
MNYRHQADIMTIHGKLIDNGYSSNSIIQLAYDDIANNPENPFNGQVFHTLDHVNIYHQDYISISGNSVTAQQFYSTLTSIPTSSSDNVFVYYDNHGGPDILGVPDGVSGGYIYGEDLAAAFNTMSSNGLYKYLLFGIEACYSGSVAKLFTAPNMGTITAANDAESSYAAVYDSTLGTYLSNEFTNYWINEMDINPTQAVGDLYDNLKSQTTGSHVCWYGAENIKTLLCSDFFGTHNAVASSKALSVDIATHSQATAATFKALLKSTNPRIRAHARLAMSEYQAKHDKLTIALEEIVKAVAPRNWSEMLNKKDSTHTSAYVEIVKAFTEKFGLVNGDDLPLFVVFRNLAASYPKDQIINAINNVL